MLLLGTRGGGSDSRGTIYLSLAALCYFQKSTKRNHDVKCLQNSKVVFCFLGFWHNCQKDKEVLNFASAKCYIKQTLYYDFRHLAIVLVYKVF